MKQPLCGDLITPSGCRLCQDKLEPNPVVQMGRNARLLIIGQAPGLKVHQTGIPWNDPSGRRLRQWLGMSPEVFYDADKVAILPMGFCYPGRGKSGDNPPDPRCAPKWHATLLGQLPKIELTLLIGQYAQRHYLGKGRSLTETVQDWRACGPHRLPLPHPSPRNQLWFKRHPWFEQELVPELQRRIGQLGL
ncbi:uracil-DNA glycosylase family protein [Ferrimonas marina]|uniref:Uracil-DNA glycosylase n=1 Tax=Ferrimonas marina TaxID=299255 RepID=A0A1M5XE08_9GAMM|nr:uracil-DNA glycosylase family protein [Ferrimonas marina]SHH98115.1 Uracil-DNA glycosylase [Ferrimonas marina]